MSNSAYFLLVIFFGFWTCSSQGLWFKCYLVCGWIILHQRLTWFINTIKQCFITKIVEQKKNDLIAKSNEVETWCSMTCSPCLNWSTPIPLSRSFRWAHIDPGFNRIIWHWISKSCRNQWIIYSRIGTHRFSTMFQRSCQHGCINDRWKVGNRLVRLLHPNLKKNSKYCLHGWQLTSYLRNAGHISDSHYCYWWLQGHCCFLLYWGYLVAS